MIWVRPTLDNDLHNSDHIDEDLNNGTDNDRLANSLVAGRETGQQKPHHARAGDHGRRYSQGLGEEVPFHGMKTFLISQVEEMPPKTPVGTREC